MERAKHNWKKVPHHIRKPVVLVVGLLFVVAAALTGWLPGPGGLPLFLIGIAILATEFEWAERIRVRVMTWVHIFGIWFKQHRLWGVLLILGGLCFATAATYLLYFRF